MNVSDTCNAAADLIEVRGWTVGHKGWQTDGGPLCLEGALAAASGIEGQFANIDVLTCPAFLAVRDHLGVEKPYIWNDTRSLQMFSDNPHPDHSPESRAWGREQVVAVLRAVAVIEAAREDTEAKTAVPA